MFEQAFYPDLSVRLYSEQDMDFLRRVFISSRQEEFAQVAWTEQQREAFFTQQFMAQHTYYAQMYPQAWFWVILLKDTPIGRVYVNRYPDEYRLMEITLLAEFRQRGIGTAFLREIMRQAQDESVAVRLHVEPFNPALRMYQRHGFTVLEQRGAYLFMEWKATEAVQS